MLFGFAPWIVYWVLVGNVPFLTAVLVALATAVAALVVGRLSAKPGRTLQIGAVATFAVLTVLTFALSQSFMERWMQPLSNAGIFLVALVGVMTGQAVRARVRRGGPAGRRGKQRPFRSDHDEIDLDLGGCVRGYDGLVGDSADRAGRRDDSRHQDAAVVRLLLGDSVRLAVRGCAGVEGSCRTG